MSKTTAPWKTITNGIVTASGTQHKVTDARSWVSPHGAFFTDWKTACGLKGTTPGAERGTGGLPVDTTPEGLLSNGRYRRMRRMACPACTAKGWL